eukprot:gb/GECG01015255.1/.p1 GENE.gb/GECG01015255.1/~~gb/GECG01015255.1/.p1  ORF type:complete len:147 (+),score=17.20 gb/GECG01015255.1/:1-441(+)
MQRERIGILSALWDNAERQMIESARVEERKLRDGKKRRSIIGSPMAKEKLNEVAQSMLPVKFRKQILEQDLQYRHQEYIDRLNVYQARLRVLEPYIATRRRQLEIAQRLAHTGPPSTFRLDDSELNKVIPSPPARFSFVLNGDALK